MKIRLWPYDVTLVILTTSELLSDCFNHIRRNGFGLGLGPSPAGGPVVPDPHLKSVPPISRLAPRLLHTSNIVFFKCGPLSGFWPLLLVFGPPAAKSWRRACCSALPPLSANLHQHAWLLGRQHMHTFWRRCLAVRKVDVEEECQDRPWGTPFLRRRNLFHLPFPAVRVKLRLPTISMIMQTMCLSGGSRSSLQVRPRCHTVS